MSGTVALRALGVACVLGMVAVWVAMTELLAKVEEDYFHPYLLTFIIHAGYALCLPMCSVLVFLEKRQLGAAAEQGLLNTRPTIARVDKQRAFHKVALLVGTVSFIGAYVWYLSLHNTVPSANNAIFQSLGAFVFLLSVPLIGETVTAPKLLAVVVAVGGIVLVSLYSDHGDVRTDSSFMGYVLCVAATMCSALYQVSVKKWGPKARSRRESMFNSFALLGWMGVYSAVVGWIGIPVVHVCGFERIEAPSTDVALLLVANVVLDTIFNFLLVFAVDLTSPLFVSMGSMLVMPGTLVTDMIVHGVKVTPGASLGCVLILASFVLLQVPGRVLFVMGGAQRASIARSVSTSIVSDIER